MTDNLQPLPRGLRPICPGSIWQNHTGIRGALAPNEHRRNVPTPSGRPHKRESGLRGKPWAWGTFLLSVILLLKPETQAPSTTMADWGPEYCRCLSSKVWDVFLLLPPSFALLFYRSHAARDIARFHTRGRFLWAFLWQYSIIALNLQRLFACIFPMSPCSSMTL